eukprot:1166529-Prymnesium_polylepis.1
MWDGGAAHDAAWCAAWHGRCVACGDQGGLVRRAARLLVLCGAQLAHEQLAFRLKLQHRVAARPLRRAAPREI